MLRDAVRLGALMVFDFDGTLAPIVKDRAAAAGDDETDEDAFRSRVVTWGVRVGRAEPSAARFYLDDQAGVDALLRSVVAEYARRSAP